MHRAVFILLFDIYFLCDMYCFQENEIRTWVHFKKIPYSWSSLHLVSDGLNINIEYFVLIMLIPSTALCAMLVAGGSDLPQDVFRVSIKIELCT